MHFNMPRLMLAKQQFNCNFYGGGDAVDENSYSSHMHFVLILVSSGDSDANNLEAIMIQ